MQPLDITEKFTARQLADASGRSRQNIQQLLEHIPHSGQRLVKGNLAAVWQLSALPAAFQIELQSIAQKRGHADAFALLSGPAPLWQPPVPLAQISPAALDKAAKLRAIQEPDLLIKNNDTRTQAEFEAQGVARYQKVFGHPISGRWYRQLFKRTIDRDNGAENWTRLEIYLDDIAPAPATPRPAAVNKLPETLAALVKTLDNPARPTAEDAKFLFDAAFRHLEDQAAIAPDAAAALRSLIHSLYAAVPTLAVSPKAFRKMWKRKHAAWLLAAGDLAALEDQRRLRSGNFRKPDFSADEQKIRDEAILHDGSIALAFRKLRQAGQLSENFVKYYEFNPRKNKSYVPGTVRQAITPQVQMCGPIHHGPWLAKMRGPYIPRDWSAVQPADWFSGDDFTLNHVWSDYDANGNLQLWRGECLILIDLRTGYILDYVLIAGKYNSRHIRKLILKIHDRHGLPHTGFYFERGVWKARIIRDLDARENFKWRETESGLAQFNLQVKHATTPRAKTIEGLGRIWQERMRPEEGFVGFDERRDEREVIQDYLARVRRGTAAPSKLLSMEQWAARLDAIFLQYNNDPQCGKMLRGQSPAEAWQTGLQRKPLRQLPEDARYLLATHCQRVTVRQHGIALTIGGNKMLFCNQHTGQLIGREVLAFYNLDCPDLLTVSDLNRQNYFTVKAIALPAMSATKEQFSIVHDAISGHRKTAKEIYGNIQRPSAHTITRDNAVSEETRELGRFVNNETAQFQEEQTKRRRSLRKIQTSAAAAGLRLTQPVRDLDDAAEAVDRLAEIRARRAARQNNEATP